MSTRHAMLATGEMLRQSDLFGDLSVAAATVLGSFMEPQHVAPGEIVIRQGDVGDDLFMIAAGTAEARIATGGGVSVVVGTLGPGEYFGEISLLTGAERSADVRAVTALDLLRLSRQAYVRYLAHMTAVERRLSRTATDRSRADVTKLRSRI